MLNCTMPNRKATTSITAPFPTGMKKKLNCTIPNRNETTS